MRGKPKILRRLVGQLEKQGMDTGRANATARASLQRSGVLKKGTDQLTAKGKKRESMGAEGRAKDRASKASGRKASEYSYNPRTNRATLKKKK